MGLHNALVLQDGQCSGRPEKNFGLPCHTTGEGKYRVILSTDETRFGGTGLVSHDYVYQTENLPNRGTGFYIYAPARTAMVLEKV